MKLPIDTRRYSEHSIIKFRVESATYWIRDVTMSFKVIQINVTSHVQIESTKTLSVLLQFMPDSDFIDTSLKCYKFFANIEENILCTMSADFTRIARVIQFVAK